MTKVLLLRPHLGIPFKQSLYSINNETNLPQIRQYWYDFLQKLEAHLDEKYYPNFEVVRGPLWSFNKELVEKYKPDLAFIPHKTQAQFGYAGEARYYMQMTFPHLFSVDSKGWSGSAQTYPLDLSKGNPDSDIFEQYKKRIQSNISKFDQPTTDIDGLNLPDQFIFFPFQIPHDESISLHSDFQIAEVFEALCRWASGDVKIPIIAKGHPVNPASMAPLNVIAQKYKIRVLNNVSVHRLLEKCSWVYTVNSGVGFEAFLHEKPVVTFGSCEYDAATYKQRSISNSAFTDSFSNVKFDLDAAKRLFDVFVNQYCVDSGDMITYDRIELP